MMRCKTYIISTVSGRQNVARNRNEDIMACYCNGHLKIILKENRK